MKTKRITEKNISKFKEYLIEEEKSLATIEKYIRDINKFYKFLGEDKTIDKVKVIDYKTNLYNSYQISSVNSMLAAINSFLSYLGLERLRVKTYKLQKKLFSDQNKELSKEEYQRLIEAAQKNENTRLSVLIQAICSTGIRVSEHAFITVEAIKLGRSVVQNKGKIREIYFSKKTKQLLLTYCKQNDIKSGCVFITKSGKPLNRSNIWKMMKVLCITANVDEAKVFPHNLRHLFAFTYYSIDKDLIKLAGILGHASIETTRIYTMTNGFTCAAVLSKMDLIPSC